MTRALIVACGLLWGATVLAAAATAGLAPDLVEGVPRDALDPSLATAWALLSHNAVVSLWPLALVALGWPQIPLVRGAGDVLMAGQLLAHGVTVGVAVGAQPVLWRFLPHLPAEWLGLAAPVAAWFLTRRTPAAAGDVRRLLGVSIAALVVAAALETWAVPL